MQVDIFRQWVKRAVESGLTVRLANEFQVAESTVLRWLGPVATPLPRLRKMIVEWIAKETNGAG